MNDEEIDKLAKAIARELAPLLRPIPLPPSAPISPYPGYSPYPAYPQVWCTTVAPDTEGTLYNGS